MDNIIALAEKIVKAIPGLVDETEEFSCEENISSFDGFSVSENRDDEWDVYLTYKLKYASVERALKANHTSRTVVVRTTSLMSGRSTVSPSSTFAGVSNSTVSS